MLFISRANREITFQNPWGVFKDLNPGDAVDTDYAEFMAPYANSGWITPQMDSDPVLPPEKVKVRFSKAQVMQTVKSRVTPTSVAGGLTLETLRDIVAVSVNERLQGILAQQGLAGATGIELGALQTDPNLNPTPPLPADDEIEAALKEAEAAGNLDRGQLAQVDAAVKAGPKRVTAKGK